MISDGAEAIANSTRGSGGGSSFCIRQMIISVILHYHTRDGVIRKEKEPYQRGGKHDDV